MLNGKLISNINFLIWVNILLMIKVLSYFYCSKFSWDPSMMENLPFNFLLLFFSLFSWMRIDNVTSHGNIKLYHYFPSIYICTCGIDYTHKLIPFSLLVIKTNYKKNKAMISSHDNGTIIYYLRINGRSFVWISSLAI